MYLLPFKIYNDISLQISIFCSHIKYASNESNGYQMCIYFHETHMLQLNRIYNWASSYSEYPKPSFLFVWYFVSLICRVLTWTVPPLPDTDREIFDSLQYFSMQLTINSKSPKTHGGIVKVFRKTFSR